MLSRIACGVMCVIFMTAAEAQAARVTASAMDANGNVYVTGWRAVVAGSQWEISTTKYDKNGNKVWSHNYPNSAAMPDAESWGLAVDPAGNVYVAAHVGTATDVDCLLIKYPYDYMQGDDPEWVRTWDGGYGHDQHWTIAIDSDGFIYVTGYSMQSHEGVLSSDIVTMKYDGAGNMVWGAPALYNGPANGGENGFAIVVDPVTKNVFVTGRSRGAENSLEIITIMYDSGGAQKWAQRYKGPVATGVNGGTSLALDEAGAVYVTGTSQSSTGLDIVTLKYDAQGHQLWVSRYDGPGNSNDQPAPLAGGTTGIYNGNYMQNNQGLIVATEVLNPVPELRYLIGRVDALDVGRGLRTALLAKLNASLDSLLSPNADVRRNAPHVLGAFVNQMQALMAEGQMPAAVGRELTAVANQIIKGILGIGTTVVYVTGQSTNAAGNPDFVTIKYNAADGSPMWNLPGQPGTTPEKSGTPANIALRYNGPANSTDRSWAIAMDGDGNIFATGPSMADSARSVDFYTTKYFVNTYQPAVLAEARYDGTGHGIDQACGFAMWRDPESGRYYIYRDASGKDYVVVTGNSIGTDTSAPSTQDYLTIAYDGKLAQRWLQRYYW